MTMTIRSISYIMGIENNNILFFVFEEYYFKVVNITSIKISSLKYKKNGF